MRDTDVKTWAEAGNGNGKCVQAIHVAAFYGRDDIVKLLVEKRAEVDVREVGEAPPKGKEPKLTATPLHVATWYHNEAVVKVRVLGLDSWGLDIKVATSQVSRWHACYGPGLSSSLSRMFLISCGCW